MDFLIHLLTTSLILWLQTSLEVSELKVGHCMKLLPWVVSSHYHHPNLCLANRDISSDITFNLPPYPTSSYFMSPSFFMIKMIRILASSCIRIHTTSSQSLAISSGACKRMFIRKKHQKKPIVKSGFYYGLIMINPHIWWMVTHFFGISILGMQTSWSCEPIPPQKKNILWGGFKNWKSSNAWVSNGFV